MAKVIDITSRLRSRIFQNDDLLFLGLSEESSLEEIHATWEFLAAGIASTRKRHSNSPYQNEEKYQRLVEIGIKLRRAMSAGK